jgi:hypothetical protein
MDGRDRRAHMFVREREQPADAFTLVDVEAERLKPGSWKRAAARSGSFPAWDRPAPAAGSVSDHARRLLVLRCNGYETCLRAVGAQFVASAFLAARAFTTVAVTAPLRLVAVARARPRPARGHEYRHERRNGELCAALFDPAPKGSAALGRRAVCRPPPPRRAAGTLQGRTRLKLSARAAAPRRRFDSSVETQRSRVPTQDVLATKFHSA